jgi:GT2 family glycosyltransferase
MLIASIVLYKTNINQLIKCINSIESYPEAQIFLIDNSPTDDLKKIGFLFKNIVYIFNPQNPGYGAGHNIALRHSLNSDIRYHLVLNADVYFDAGTIDVLVDYMNHRPSVGLVMPKVLFPNGEIQRLCKLVPTPIDLVSRILLPKSLLTKKNFKFEMQGTGYSKEMFVPYLSGCFMLLRVDALRVCGLFDESFFMYPEDIDLTRRIASKYKTMFYPGAVIYHEHGAASKKSIKIFLIHVFNIIKYFNKWGWIFDSERARLNKIAGTNPNHNESI